MTFARPLRWLLGLVLAGLAALCLGFLWFLRMTGPAPALPAQADGIVVLTGGPERIESGLRLLAAGRATQLLVTGLGGGTELPELARRAGLDPAPLASRVTLGRNATTTHTNASETAQWVQDKKIHALIVVTSGYHMPRALAELRQAMPGVTFHPAPVLPEGGHGRSPSWRLLAEEYAKWVVVVAGLSDYVQGSGAARRANAEY